MNYAYYPCWMRHQRPTNQDKNRVNLPGPGLRARRPDPESAPRPVLEPELNLPNSKRAANTFRHCVINGCISQHNFRALRYIYKRVQIICSRKKNK